MNDDSNEPAADAEPVEAKPVKPPKAVKPPKPPKPPKAKKAKKGPNLVLFLVPVALIAGLVLAFTFPPTHAMLANGPLKPLLARIGLAPKKTVATAAQTADPAADVKRLTDEVNTTKKTAAAKDAQIAGLQSQVTELQAKPTSTPAPKVSPLAVSDEVKRVATYWAGMDADKAADIVKALPDAYVKRVFGQMPADSVSDIMSALPAKTAARLTAPDAADTTL